MNGGFEGSVDPWVESGNGFFYTSDFPHGGANLVSLGVNNSATGQVVQSVSIPPDAQGTLTFWLNVTTNENSNGRGFDQLFVEVRDLGGNLLGTLATYSNLNRSTAGNYSQKTLDMSGYLSQTVNLQFRAVNDGSRPTTFRIDDVSLR